MIHIYTGNGKGKTTAAVGLLLRALAHGFKVEVVQFLKNKVQGEMLLLKNKLNVKINCFGVAYYITNSLSKEKYKEVVSSINKGLEYSQHLINTPNASANKLIVFDEILTLIKFNLVDEIRILAFLESAKAQPQLELILTGHFISPALCKVADVITIMKKQKHYFDNGIPARPGIEY